MSVVDTDIIDPESGFTIDQNGTRARLALLVTTDAVTDGLATIRTWLDSNGYAIGDAHPEDSELLLSTIDGGRQDDSDYLWKVTVDYGLPPTGSAPNEDPLSRPATYRWMGAADLKEYSVDVDGNILANSAHEPFDIPPQRYEGSWAVEVVYNLDASSHPAAGALHCTINDDTSPSTARRSPRAGLWIYRDGPKLKENGVTFYQVTVEILIKPAGETWDDSSSTPGTTSCRSTRSRRSWTATAPRSASPTH
jgi:hypothetical protein